MLPKKRFKESEESVPERYIKNYIGNILAVKISFKPNNNITFEKETTLWV
ncbi:hypothetical protein KU06112801_1800002 [Flavobacterium psychrophilum]|nr:hypothetical protein FI070_430055 [Flavobacterium psychrophilum]SNB09193.1 hypothetical protein KU06112801_1800002 [Flavobacterium psychrophilum]